MLITSFVSLRSAHAPLRYIVPRKQLKGVTSFPTPLNPPSLMNAFICKPPIKHNNKSLKCFKNQPTILKLPTLLTKTRQLNQTLQRNRLNTSTLLTNTNKQPQLRHPTSPQGIETKQTYKKYIQKIDAYQNTG